MYGMTAWASPPKSIHLVSPRTYTDLDTLVSSMTYTVIESTSWPVLRLKITCVQLPASDLITLIIEGRYLLWQKRPFT